MIRFDDEFIPGSGETGSDLWIGRQIGLLKSGDPEERRTAILELIRAGAEAALTECLRAGDDLTVKLASIGLWECWLREKGNAARQRIQEGVERMDQGDLDAAEAIFLALMREFPEWAEAFNKQATLLYQRGRYRESLELCEKVVMLKPNHFGAWHGMALCAMRLEDWHIAFYAARQASKLQPSVEANHELIRLAEAKLGEEK